MGRPIKSSFFGNLNNENHNQVGASGGIGGEGIFSIANPGTLGNILVNNAHPNVSALLIPSPAIPTGVQATARVTWEVATVTVTNGTAGHNYHPNTNATLTGLGGGVVVHIATVGSGQGEVQTVDFNSTGSNRGSFTTIPTTAVTYQIVGSGAGNGDGNNQTQVTYRVKSITVTNPGSGYDVIPTLSWNNTGVVGTPPSAPVATMQTIEVHKAIEGVAFIPSGSAARVYDIVKQEGSRSYLVQTNQGLGRCKLVAGTPAAGEMTMIATDANGNTYYVTKLTGRKAILTRKTHNGSSAWVYETNAAAPWNVGTAAGNIVSIAHTI